MIQIKVYNEKEIDIPSNTVKKEIINSIINYITNNWEYVVKSTSYKEDDTYYAKFDIEL